MNKDAAFSKLRDSKSPSFLSPLLSKISMPMLKELRGVRSSWELFFKKHLRASLIYGGKFFLIEFGEHSQVSLNVYPSHIHTLVNIEIKLHISTESYYY